MHQSRSCLGNYLSAHLKTIQRRIRSVPPTPTHPTGSRHRLAGGDHQAHRARCDRQDPARQLGVTQGLPRECLRPKQYSHGTRIMLFPGLSIRGRHVESNRSESLRSQNEPRVLVLNINATRRTRRPGIPRGLNVFPIAQRHSTAHAGSTNDYNKLCF